MFIVYNIFPPLKMIPYKKLNFLLFSSIFSLGFGYQIDLTCNNTNIVVGATLKCTAKILSNNELANGDYRYTWRDDAIPKNIRVHDGESVDYFAATYNNTEFNTPGSYTLRVTVCQLIFSICAPFTTNSLGIDFYLTETFNGQLEMRQGNLLRENFVSTNATVTNFINFTASDKEFIGKAPNVLSYWFVDCVYYGITKDLNFSYNFTKSEEQHTVETLVVADFTPIPAPIITTTTTSTTVAPITTNKTPTKIPTTAKAKVNSSVNNSTIKIWQNGTLVPYNGTFPYICNSSIVMPDDLKTYGYFAKKVTTKNPIINVTVSGNYWVQHGELLSLNVKCKGSEKIQFCTSFKQGLYNVTGNETCVEYFDLEKCDFPIQRYLQDQHTLIIILRNDVSHIVTSVAITVYKVKQQAQLSVIVVPVAFSLVAVVTVIFGVAYYLQNRSRFIVEVADFDFGPKYADMEYKTFRERLNDSLVHAFNRNPIQSTSESSNHWTNDNKYGSLT